MRRGNPDLINEDELQDRVEKVCEQWQSNGVLKLERVTLFVTDRCNLACRYCNGPHMAHNVAGKEVGCLGFLPLKTFENWLNNWAKAGLKHLHFTGGEPATHPLIVEFVRMAKAGGIPSSITSNGTLPLKKYLKLLRAGLWELRISIDSSEPKRIDAIVGRRGAGRRLLANLLALRRLREKGKRDFWLVLNSCLDDYSPRELCRRLRALRRFRPDDIKVLVVTQERSGLRSLACRSTVEALSVMVEGWGGFPLLKRKLKDMFRVNGAGIKDPLAQAVSKRCMIPLLERTLDETGLYPCSIYKRHYGQPLAPTSASLDEQQAAITRFVETHDCRRDAICVNHCVGCCKQMNLRANLALEGRPALAAASSGRLAQAPGFLIIKPLGLPHLKNIMAHLRRQGLGLTRARAIQRWQGLAMHLYAKSDMTLATRLGRMARHLNREGQDRALLIEAPEAPWGLLKRLKDELRLLFPMGRPSDGLKLNVVHAPDEGEMQREWQLVRGWVGEAV